MSSTIGKQVRVTLFGQSHGPVVGVVVDGFPAGEWVDMQALQAFLNRRAPGRGPLASARKEADRPRIVSGMTGDRTNGAPLCALLDNGDARPGEYEALADMPRPGHADFPARIRYGETADLRGGGHFSARLTAPLCVAGGMALQMLARRGITVGAHAAMIAGIEDMPFDPVALEAETLRQIGSRLFPVLDVAAGERMQAAILEAQNARDSVGGVVECAAIGLPAGLGAPIFDGVENRLSAALFGIPAVRGVSFGDGFAAAGMRGSAHNDGYCVQDGHIKTRTNHHGGVLGGMTTGMPLLVKVACKPTPSIGLPQQTVRWSTGEEETMAIHGRHDPCVVPRAVPCVEAAVALVLLDMLLEGGNGLGTGAFAPGD